MKILISLALLVFATPAYSFVEDGLSNEPCATELADSYVEDITIRESVEEQN